MHRIATKQSSNTSPIESDLGEPHSSKNGSASASGARSAIGEPFQKAESYTDRRANPAARLSQHRSESVARLRSSITGQSFAMGEIRRIVTEVAATNASVLIQGESGVGKERVAEAIHRLSDRRKGPFVPINMAAVPEGLAESILFGHSKGAFTSANADQQGLCEAADGGTLFLDEIGELERPMQPKLLRFLQEGAVQRVGETTARRVDTRIIAATNRDPRQMVIEGSMREDLFFRLHVVPIHIPPLRERPEDVEELVGVFLSNFNLRHGREVEGVCPEAMALLKSYDWPGNVRQLENTIERMVIFAKGPSLQPAEIPNDLHVYPQPRYTPGVPSSGAAAPRFTAMERTERNAMISALEQAGGHVGDAAQLLGVGQATVYRKIKYYQIPHERKRRKRSAK